MKKQYFYRTQRVRVLLAAVLFFLTAGAMAQGRGGAAAQPAKPYSIIIKGGRVIDPKNNIDGIMDIAITRATGGGGGRGGRGGAAPAAGQPAPPPPTPAKIALVAKAIDAKLADRVIDAAGLIVSPGLIDLHVHVFWGHDGSSYMNAPASIPPDPVTFRSGVTTVVDAGTSGYQSFELFKKQSIDNRPNGTRVLAFLNINGPGMCCGESNIAQMDAQKAGEMAKKYPDIIVGIKTAHVNNNGQRWVAIDRAEEAGRIANIPIMVDFGSGNPYLSLDTLFNIKFRPGDIYTHAFGGDEGDPGTGGRESIVDVKAGKVKDYVYKARQRGIIFDIGFGGGSFWYRQGIIASKEKFWPNSISTDLHTGSMNTAMKSMENIMSLFMAMGMPVKEVIKASTWNPAQEIKRPELGNLSVGSVPDIAIFRVITGKFGWPVRGGKITGAQRLMTEATIRNGQLVYDLNGLGMPTGPDADRPMPAVATQPRPATAPR